MDSTNRADNSERQLNDIFERERALGMEFEEKQRQLDDIIRQRGNLLREQIALLTSRMRNTTNNGAPINSGTVDPDNDNSEDSGEDSDDEDSDPDEDIPEDSDKENSVTWNNAKPEEKTFFIYDTCCVCLDEKPAMFNIPCGHVCLCKDCNTKNVGRNECPICRKVITYFYVIKRS